jgi:hypothetical protein
MEYGYREYAEDLILHCFDQMPTTVFRMYTREGFVVAADGREYDPVKPAVVNENVRKVFTLRNTSTQATYAISGTNILQLLDDRQEIDFMPVIHDAMNRAFSETLEDIENYSLKVMESLQPLPDRIEEKPTILYLDAYIGDIPQQSMLFISHSAERSQQLPELLTGGKARGCGSGLIIKMLERWPGVSAGAIEKYRSERWDIPERERKLVDAIDLAKSWIEAHFSPEALEIDNEKCKTMGGTAHLCINRFGRPFEWMFRDPQTREWKSCSPPTGATVP